MDLSAFLQRSAATESFRQAVGRFLRDGRSCERVSFNHPSPPVKVERTLAKVLEAYPELPVERVEIHASTGCEFFRGTATIHAAGEERLVRFDWDCRWRAEAEGWRDYFGFPDQARAAREFGWDCFRGWQEVEVRAPALTVEMGALRVETRAPSLEAELSAR
jgi:hypothetical protein